jgi:AcrR family transcriptional regulator
VATQEERRSRTRAALVEQATKTFGTVGYDSAGINEIAEAAGVTRGALYHHFKGKDELFEAVFRFAETELQHAVRDASAKARTPLDGLKGGCRAFLLGASQTGTSRILLVDGPAALGWTRYKQIDEEFFLADIAELLRLIRPDIKQRLALTLVASAIIASVCELASHVAHRKATLKQATSAVDTLLDGLNVQP